MRCYHDQFRLDLIYNMIPRSQMSDDCPYCGEELTERTKRYLMSGPQLAWPRSELEDDHQDKYEYKT